MKKLIWLLPVIVIAGCAQLRSHQDCANGIQVKIVAALNNSKISDTILDNKQLLETDDGKCVALFQTSPDTSGTNVQFIYDLDTDRYTANYVNQGDPAKEQELNATCLIGTCLNNADFVKYVNSLFVNPLDMKMQPRKANIDIGL